MNVFVCMYACECNLTVVLQFDLLWCCFFYRFRSFLIRAIFFVVIIINVVAARCVVVAGVSVVVTARVRHYIVIYNKEAVQASVVRAVLQNEVISLRGMARGKGEQSWHKVHVKRATVTIIF